MPTRYLSRLRLSHFRNYASAALDLDQRHLVLPAKAILMNALPILGAGGGYLIGAEIDKDREEEAREAYVAEDCDAFTGDVAGVRIPPSDLIVAQALVPGEGMPRLEFRGVSDHRCEQPSVTAH